jgi:hypothetical protein
MARHIYQKNGRQAHGNRRHAVGTAAAGSSSSKQQQAAASSTHEVKGHSKKKVTDPCVYLINFRGTNQPQNIISWAFFLVHFWAFLGEGSSKTRPKKSKKSKSMSKTFPEKILRKSTKVSMSVFLDFLGFIAFSVVS